MLRKIFKTGHSLAVTLSKKQLEDLGLALGDSVNVSFDQARHTITVKPDKRHEQLSLDIKPRSKL